MNACNSLSGAHQCEGYGLRIIVSLSSQRAAISSLNLSPRSVRGCTLLQAYKDNIEIRWLCEVHMVPIREEALTLRGIQ
jgi:hypothetical protein